MLTGDVKMFGTAATMQEFSEKLLKWQADVGGGQQNAQRLKRSRWKRQICRYLLDAELNLFHYMLKYNYSFFDSNIYGNVIAFMGYHPLRAFAL